MATGSSSARVFRRAIPSGRTGRVAKHTLAKSSQLLTSESVVGQTPHFVIYTDGTVEGNMAAQSVLAACEADFAAVQVWFGGIDLPPWQDRDNQSAMRAAQLMHVLMDPNAGGAYHYSCAETNFYIEPTPANQASALVTAEVVEVFETAINNGWDCGHTNGAALSRVLAVERHANLAAVTVPTEQRWWRNGHQDYINDNTATDQNEGANGCGALFLYYLHTQLGFSWTQIATIGGGSLGDTYQKLTGRDPSAGFRDFLERLATIAQGGQLNVPDSGDPFPIRLAASAPPIGGSRTAAVIIGILVAAIGIVAILVILALVTDTL